MTTASATDRLSIQDDPIDLVKPFTDGSDSPLMAALPRIPALDEDVHSTMNIVPIRSVGRWADGYSGYDPMSGTYTVPSKSSQQSQSETSSSNEGYGGYSEKSAKSKYGAKSNSKSNRSTPSGALDPDTPSKKSGKNTNSKYNSKSADFNSGKSGKTKTGKKSNPDSGSYTNTSGYPTGKPSKGKSKSIPGTGSGSAYNPSTEFNQSNAIEIPNSYSSPDNSDFSSGTPQSMLSSPLQVPSATQGESPDSLSAYQLPGWENSLTRPPSADLINEQLVANEAESEQPSVYQTSKWGYSMVQRPGDDFAGPVDELGFFEKVGDGVKNLVGKIFKKESENLMIPAAVPPPVNPANEEIHPEFFRDGYISQRDIEKAVGSDPWTLCCATSLIYAVQSKYPGIPNTDLFSAAAAAAKTTLNDESGPCVSADGNVNSIYQYSQALSKDLGLEDYVDTPGSYPSLEEARKDGVVMSKVELSGKIDESTHEHHVFQYGSTIIDPIPGDGVTSVMDEGSIQVENVMALSWYPMPCDD